MLDLIERTGTIKALSLWQPWASLMAAGVKLHETRHWSTRYRGPLAIHAAKTLDVAGAPEELCLSVWGVNWCEACPLGAVLAIGRLTRCEPTGWLANDRLTAADEAAGNFAPGRFAWRVEGLSPLIEPIPLIGHQGLFNWSPPADLGQLLRQPVDHRDACSAVGWA
jgi:hypothetical protein